MPSPHTSTHIDWDTRGEGVVHTHTHTHTDWDTRGEGVVHTHTHIDWPHNKKLLQYTILRNDIIMTKRILELNKLHVRFVTALHRHELY